MLIVDEAWTFLSQPEGLASLQRISREGRSLNILPVFLTQRIADVVTKDLESYLSRVLVLKLNEKKEAETAVRLCGLQPTPERLAEIREFGPLPAEGDRPARWARGIFRDLSGRHAQVVLGPTPRKRRRRTARTRWTVACVRSDESPGRKRSAPSTRRPSPPRPVPGKGRTRGSSTEVASYVG